MTPLRAFFARLRSLWEARSLDARLDEEMRSHLELAIDDNLRRGMSYEAARTAALRSFGGTMQTREQWRDVRAFPFLTSIWQDIRYAVRGYRRTPVFSAVAVVTLMLAIGANTAIFSLLNALVLRSLPVRDPATLVQIASTSPTSGYEAGLTYPMYQRVSTRRDLFSSAIGWLGSTVMTVETEREQTPGAIWVVSGTFFSELGARPSAGRTLTPDDVNETTLQAEPVAMIGYRFWQTHFGGDAAAIGQRIVIEGRRFTIVGVGPRGFTGLGWIIEPDVLLPLTAWPLINDLPVESLRAGTSFFVRTTARLRPGVTLAQAAAALEAEWPELKRATLPPAYTPAQRDRFLASRLVVRSAANGVEPGLRSRFTRALVIVFGIAALILVIACVNLASLMLARAAARSHEIGVRLALGAGRWRIARQMILEGVVISSVGAACGIAFAFWISREIVTLIFRDYLVAASLDVAPDGRVLTFASALAILAGVLFSLAPAVRASRLRTSELLQASTRTTSGVGRSGKLLVGVQVALSLVLLTNAGLLVRTLQQIRAVDSGMQPAQVLVAFPGPLPGGYAGVNNDVYYPQAIERLQAVPGVQRATISLSKPAGGGVGGGEPVSLAATPGDSGVASLLIDVAPGFFDTVGVPLRSGRDFAWSDNSKGRRVAMVSETLARRLVGGADAAGRHIRVGALPRRQDLEIVGVVADAHLYDLKDPNVAAVYVPALQEPDANYKCFVVRGASASLADINRAIESLGRERVRSMQSMAYITDDALLRERLTAALAAFFGGLALLLAAIGLYGLMSYTVAQRRREIGIRVALGAEPARVMRAVVREASRIALGGVAAGFVAAVASVRLVQSLLFGVTPHDAFTLLGAPAVLVVVAIAASLFPAARAARVDPMVALRSD